MSRLDKTSHKNLVNMKKYTLFILTLILTVGLWSACKSPSYVADSSASDGESVDLGYTKVNSRNYVGSSSTVEDKNANGNLIDYLARVPGLLVNGSGQNASVKVRGLNDSFYGSTDPLFVVDGVRAGTSLQQVSSLLSVSQIARVTVLKDAGDTAIYGVSGANGVVVIRTKKSTPKKTKTQKK